MAYTTIRFTDDVYRPDDGSGMPVPPRTHDLGVTISNVPCIWYTELYSYFQLNNSQLESKLYIDHTIFSRYGVSSSSQSINLKIVVQLSKNSFATSPIATQEKEFWLNVGSAKSVPWQRTKTIYSRNYPGDVYHSSQDVYERSANTTEYYHVYSTIGLVLPLSGNSITRSYFQARAKIQYKSGNNWVDCQRSNGTVWKTFESYAPFYQSVTIPSHVYGNAVNQFASTLYSFETLDAYNVMPYGRLVRKASPPYDDITSTTTNLYWAPCISNSYSTTYTKYSFDMKIKVVDPSDSNYMIIVADRTVSGSLEFKGTDETNMFSNPSWSIIDPTGVDASGTHHDYYGEYGVILRNVTSELQLSVQIKAMYGAIVKLGYYPFGLNTRKDLPVIETENATYGTITLPIPTSGSSTQVGVWLRTNYNYSEINARPTIQIIDYSLPTLTNMSIHRCNSNGEANDMGEYCKIEWAVDIEPINNQNSKKLVIKHPAGTETRDPLDSYTESGILIVAANASRSYDISFTITDDINSIIRSTKLSTAGVTMDWLYDGKGVAFGKVSETANSVEISQTWDLICEKLRLAGVDFNLLLSQILTRIDGLEQFANNMGSTSQYQVTYLNADELLKRMWVRSGNNATPPTTTPERESTNTRIYSFVGWNTNPNSNVNDPDASTNIQANRSIYAIFNEAIRYYTVFYCNGADILQTVPDKQYHNSTTYDGSTPVSPDGYTFAGWLPSGKYIDGTINANAQFYDDTEITDSWAEIMEAVGDGTAIAKYNPGNYKELDCGTYGKCVMRIKGFKIDNMPSSRKKVLISWEGADCLNLQKRMNPAMEATGTHDRTVYEWTDTYNGTYWYYQFVSNILSNTYGGNGYYVEVDADIRCLGVGTLKILSASAQNTVSSGMTLEITVDDELVATVHPSSTSYSTVYTITVSANQLVNVKFRYYNETSLSSSAKLNVCTRINWSAVTNGAQVFYTVSSKKATYPDGYVEHKGCVNGWKDTELRAFLNSDLYNQIDPVVRNKIKTVGKISKIVVNNEEIDSRCSYSANDETQDKVYVPSQEELFGNVAYEHTGVDFLTEAAYRTKYVHGTNTRANYWLRSAAIASHTWSILDDEYTNNSTNCPYGFLSTTSTLYTTSDSSTNKYICIGFCT